MGHADDGGVGDAGMLDEAVLDLDAVDVLAAADDHVLGPVGDEQVAVVVEVADVAGVQPAVDDRRRRRLGLVPVARHDDRALDEDLAGLAGVRGACRRASAMRELDGRHRQADRVGLSQRVGAGERVATGRRLGEAVGVGRRLCTFGNVSRTRRCSSSADGEPPKPTEHDRRRVVVVAVGVLADPPDHGRHRRPDRRPARPGSADSAFSGSNLPSSITSLSPPIIPTTRLEWQPDDVEQRRGEQGDRLRRPAVSATRSRHRLRLRPAPSRSRSAGTPCSGGWRSWCGGCDRALGPPGRARRVEDDRGVVLVDRDVGEGRRSARRVSSSKRCSFGAGRPQSAGRRRSGRPRSRVSMASTSVGDALEALRVGDEDLGAGVLRARR